MDKLHTVYKIQIDNKYYIGRTSTGFLDRKRKHLYELRKESHPNKELQKYFDSGIQLKFSKVEEGDEFEMRLLEHNLIDINDKYCLNELKPFDAEHIQILLESGYEAAKLSYTKNWSLKNKENIKKANKKYWSGNGEKKKKINSAKFMIKYHTERNNTHKILEWKNKLNELQK